MILRGVLYVTQPVRGRRGDIPYVLSLGYPHSQGYPAGCRPYWVAPHPSYRSDWGTFSPPPPLATGLTELPPPLPTQPQTGLLLPKGKKLGPETREDPQKGPWSKRPGTRGIPPCGQTYSCKNITSCRTAYVGSEININHLVSGVYFFTCGERNECYVLQNKRNPGCLKMSLQYLSRLLRH